MLRNGGSSWGREEVVSRQLHSKVRNASEVHHVEVVAELPHLPAQIFQFFNYHDLERLHKYAQQLADVSLIIDLIPRLCSLYFARRLRPVQLSFLQEAALLGMGGQRRQRKPLKRW